MMQSKHYGHQGIPAQSATSGTNACVPDEDDPAAIGESGSYRACDCHGFHYVGLPLAIECSCIEIRIPVRELYL